MLSTHVRTDCSRKQKGRLQSPSAVSITASSLGRATHQISSSKGSLRGRLKELAGSITRKSVPRYHYRIPYTPNLWQDAESSDDFSSLTEAESKAKRVKMVGQTWPAIRKNVSSMASSLRTNRDSVCSTLTAGQSPRQSSSRCPKTGRAERPSCGTISDVSGGDQDPAPQLPRLSDSSSFAESLSRTGLFRIFTPLPEASMTGSIKVRNMAAANGKVPEGHVFPAAAARLALRLKGSSDASCSRTTTTTTTNNGNGARVVLRKYSRARASSSTTATAITDTANTPSQTDLEWLPRPEEPKSKPQIKKSSGFSSRHPIEWLDRVLETSYATRNPMSPKLSVSHVTMEALQRSKTCIFVEFPPGSGLPEPLRCYPGFRAALEDICDRFGDFYAPFAAYNAKTRMITLYSTETARPEDRFIDEDTAIFDLRNARSAWIKSSLNRQSSADNYPSDNTPTGISDGPTEMSDDGQFSSDETLVTEFEEENSDEDTDGIESYKREDAAEPAIHHAPPSPSLSRSPSPSLSFASSCSSSLMLFSS